MAHGNEHTTDICEKVLLDTTLSSSFDTRCLANAESQIAPSKIGLDSTMLLSAFAKFSAGTPTSYSCLPSLDTATTLGIVITQPSATNAPLMYSDPISNANKCFAIILFSHILPLT